MEDFVCSIFCDKIHLFYSNSTKFKPIIDLLSLCANTKTKSYSFPIARFKVHLHSILKLSQQLYLFAITLRFLIWNKHCERRMVNSIISYIERFTQIYRQACHTQKHTMGSYQESYSSIKLLDFCGVDFTAWSKDLEQSLYWPLYIILHQKKTTKPYYALSLLFLLLM